MAPATFTSSIVGTVTREEIEQRFIDAGWDVPRSSSPRHPLVGSSGELSIVAFKAHTESDDPVFELVDRRRILSY
jgi:hypothetical protein